MGVYRPIADSSDWLSIRFIYELIFLWGCSVGSEDAWRNVVDGPVYAIQKVLPGYSATAEYEPVVSRDLIQLQNLQWHK